MSSTTTLYKMRLLANPDDLGSINVAIENSRLIGDKTEVDRNVTAPTMPNYILSPDGYNA